MAKNDFVHFSRLAGARYRTITGIRLAFGVSGRTEHSLLLMRFVEQSGAESREDTQFRLVDRVGSTRWGESAAFAFPAR